MATQIKLANGTTAQQVVGTGTDADGNAATPVMGSLGGFTSVASVADASVGLLVAITGNANGIRLDSTIGAAAGSVLRVYSPVTCWLSWGALEAGGTGAEDNCVTPVDGKTASAEGSSMVFAAGTELLSVPASLTGQIWIAMDSVDTSTGMATITLMSA